MTTLEPAAFGRHFALAAVIAQGIVDLDEDHQAEAFTVPYPVNAQLGLDELALLGLLNGHASPHGIPDLVRWAKVKGLAEWPLDLSDDVVSEGGLLVDPLARRPTRLCTAWALHHSEDLRLEAARETLQRLTSDYGGSAIFAASIQHLIKTPVIVAKEKVTMAARPKIGRLWHEMARFYHRPEEWYFRDDTLTTCAYCGDLALPVTDGWWCPWDSSVGHLVEIGKKFKRREGVEHLAPTLRLYFALSGRRALGIQAGLDAGGVSGTRLRLEDGPWLEVVLPAGETVVVQIDDRCSPGLMALAVRRTAPLSHERTVLAVPTSWSADDRLNRLRALLGPGKTVMTDDELIKKAAQKGSWDA